MGNDAASVGNWRPMFRNDVPPAPSSPSGAWSSEEGDSPRNSRLCKTKALSAYEISGTGLPVTRRRVRPQSCEDLRDSAVYSRVAVLLRSFSVNGMLWQNTVVSLNGYLLNNFCLFLCSRSVEQAQVQLQCVKELLSVLFRNVSWRKNIAQTCPP